MSYILGENRGQAAAAGGDRGLGGSGCGGSCAQSRDQGYILSNTPQLANRSLSVDIGVSPADLNR